MQPILMINKGNNSEDVYKNYSDAAGSPVNPAMGRIGPNTIFAVTEDYGGVYRVYFYDGSWKNGYMPLYSGQKLQRAYTSSTALSYGTWTTPYGGKVTGYRFNIRRKCRVFSGTSEQTSLYSGDFVIVGGTSESGASFPDRLAIRGYSKDGTIYSLSGFCDTDINIGYNTPSSVTTWGNM